MRNHACLEDRAGSRQRGPAEHLPGELAAARRCWRSTSRSNWSREGLLPRLPRGDCFSSGIKGRVARDPLPPVDSGPGCREDEVRGWALQLASSQLGSSQPGEIANVDCRTGAGRLTYNRESGAACSRTLGCSGLGGGCCCCLPWVRAALSPSWILSSAAQCHRLAHCFLLAHTCVHTHFTQAATAHNPMLAAQLGWSVKEGENGASMLRRTKMKNIPTLKLKMF